MKKINNVIKIDNSKNTVDTAFVPKGQNFRQVVHAGETLEFNVMDSQSALYYAKQDIPGAVVSTQESFDPEPSGVFELTNVDLEYIEQIGGWVKEFQYPVKDANGVEIDSNVDGSLYQLQADIVVNGSGHNILPLTFNDDMEGYSGWESEHAFVLLNAVLDPDEGFVEKQGYGMIYAEDNDFASIVFSALIESAVPTENTITYNTQNVTHNGPATIEDDTTVSITFTADEHYVLPSNIVVSGASYTWNPETGVLELTSGKTDIEITVYAQPEQGKILNFAVSGEGSVQRDGEDVTQLICNSFSVSLNIESGYCELTTDDSITVTASPSSGYHFVYWAIDNYAIGDSTTYGDFESGATITAKFAKDETNYQQEFRSNNIEMGIVNPDLLSLTGQYLVTDDIFAGDPNDQSTRATADAEDGYSFDSWYVDDLIVYGSTGNTIGIQDGIPVIAYFHQNN